MTAHRAVVTIFDALGRLVEAAGLGDRVRAAHVEAYGTCRDCGAPLGGPSSSRICTGCHAARVLAGLDSTPPGDA